MLPGDIGLAGLTGRASCTSGRQGTSQTWCPQSMTEVRSLLAVFRDVICLSDNVFWSTSHKLHEFCVILIGEGRTRDKRQEPANGVVILYA